MLQLLDGSIPALLWYLAPEKSQQCSGHLSMIGWCLDTGLLCVSCESIQHSTMQRIVASNVQQALVPYIEM